MALPDPVPTHHGSRRGPGPLPPHSPSPLSWYLCVSSSETCTSSEGQGTASLFTSKQKT